MHHPVPIKQALRIPEAKKTVEKEWAKLEKLPAWRHSTVQPWSLVQKRAKDLGKAIHRATLMDLCHIKHYELDPQNHAYKGRVVLRGDGVKDDEGYRAVWSEQGTSASHIAAAKFLDAIAVCQNAQAMLATQSARIPKSFCQKSTILSRPGFRSLLTVDLDYGTMLKTL